MVSHFHSFTLFQKPGGHRGCHPRPNGPRRSAALGMTCVCPTALQRAPALWRSQHPRHGAASTRAASSTRAMPHPAPVPCRSQHPRHGAARGSVHLGHESPAPRCSIAIQCIERACDLRFNATCWRHFGDCVLQVKVGWQMKGAASVQDYPVQCSIGRGCPLR